MHKNLIFLNALVSVIFLFISTSAEAETGYYRSEVIADIQVFEEYIKLINSLNDRFAFKNLTSTDKVWIQAKSTIRNTVSEVKVFSNDHVLVKNSKFSFEIEFIPHCSDSQVIWVCQIHEHTLPSHFYRLHDCDNWSFK